jgi:hypothetical protein
MQEWKDDRVSKILEVVNATPEQKIYLNRFVPIYKGLDDARAVAVPLPEREEAAAPFLQRLLTRLELKCLRLT